MATITSVSPTQGKVADTININGTSLGTTISVNFGGSVITPVSVSNTLVTFVVPSSAPCAGQVPVGVNASNGARSNAVSFFVITAPTTTALSETCLPAGGGSLTVFGSGFAAGGSVQVGALTPVAFAAGGNNAQVTVTAPAHAPAGCSDTQQVTVVTAGGTSTAGTTLIDYYNPPSLATATLTPNTGPAGTETTISGASCLDGITDVTFTDSAATAFTGLAYQPLGTTSIVTIVPGAAAAGAGTFTVTTCGGTSGTATFTVTA